MAIWTVVSVWVGSGGWMTTMEKSFSPRLRIFDTLRCRQHVHSHVDRRVRRQESSEDWRKAIASDRHRGPDDDAALKAVRDAVEVARELARASQHVLRPRVDRSTGLSEMQLSAFPVEQGCPHPALERPDMCRDHRLRYAHMVGSGGDAPEGDHQFEYFQLVERNSGVNGHLRIIVKQRLNRFKQLFVRSQRAPLL